MERDLITIDIQSHSAAGLMRWGRKDEERSLFITIDIQSHSAAGLMRWGRKEEERSHYHRHTVTQCSRSFVMGKKG